MSKNSDLGIISISRFKVEPVIALAMASILSWEMPSLYNKQAKIKLVVLTISTMKRQM